MDFCFKIITMEIMSFSEFCMAHENRRVPNWMIRDFNGLNDTESATLNWTTPLRGCIVKLRK